MFIYLHFYIFIKNNILKNMPDLYISNAQKLSSHTAILQTLNRIINGVIFPVEPFAETAQQWDGKPIIYAREHPNMDSLIDNFDAEIARIGGREVGYLSNTRVETPGHPRLMSDPIITDPEVDAKIRAGRISLSTGFYASDDRVRITGNVTPNHLLVFDESFFDQPRDLGAGFLNKFLNKDDYYNSTYIKTLNRGTMTENELKAPETLTADEIAKLEKVDVEKFLNMQRQMKERLDQLAAVNNEQYEKIKSQEAKLKEFTQMERDKKWTRLEKKLPHGLVVGAEAAKTREWLNKDPEGLLEHVIDIMTTDYTNKLQEQGSQFVQHATEKLKNEASAFCSAINILGEAK